MSDRLGRSTRCKFKMGHAPATEGEQYPHIRSIRRDSIRSHRQSFRLKSRHPRLSFQGKATGRRSHQPFRHVERMTKLRVESSQTESAHASTWPSTSSARSALPMKRTWRVDLYCGLLFLKGPP
jgi:hypothetical protein